MYGLQNWLQVQKYRDILGQYIGSDNALIFIDASENLADFEIRLEQPVSQSTRQVWISGVGCPAYRLDDCETIPQGVHTGFERFVCRIQCE